MLLAKELCPGWYVSCTMYLCWNDLEINFWIKRKEGSRSVQWKVMNIVWNQKKSKSHDKDNNKLIMFIGRLFYQFLSPFGILVQEHK